MTQNLLNLPSTNSERPWKNLNKNSRHFNEKGIFDQYSHLVSLAVSPYSKRLSKSDLNDLSQEGLLVLWELIVGSNVFQGSCSDRVALRRIERKIRSQRQKQLKMNKETTEFRKKGGEFVDYPPESSAELEERKLFVFRALQTLNSDQREKIEKVFGLYGDPATVNEVALDAGVTYEAVRKALDKMLRCLAQDPDLRDLAS
jgi:DNA-directed RNA polymerase specialized sigma24 family protein